jgi:hypothetical protein
MGVMDRNRLCHCMRSQRSNFGAEPRNPLACRVFADGYRAVAGDAAAGAGPLQTDPAPDPASDTTPDGEAVVWVVVVGLGFQAIENSIGPP